MRLRFLLATLTGLLAGCSLVSGYPGATAGARQAFVQGRFAEAGGDYVKDASGGDELLYRLEAATAFQAGGLFDKSQQNLEAAETRVEEFDARPKVSGEAIAEGLGAAFLNDTSLPYEGTHYERVLLNIFQSVNYWMLGDRQGAMVEVRRALLRKEDADREDPLPVGSLPEHIFAQYLSGTLRELSGDVDNAYVDYKQVHERAPHLTCVKRDLLRLARDTGRSQDFEMWQARFPDVKPGNSIATNRQAEQSELVVIYLHGMAPQKKSFDLILPTGTSVTRVSVPRYFPIPDPAVAVRIVLDGVAAGRTELVEDLSAVVTAEFERQLPGLIAKTVARATGRAVATEVATYALSQKGNDTAAFFVSLIGGLFSTMIEQADLRSWLTLPRAFHMERLVCAPGFHDVRLELLSSGDTLLTFHDLGKLEFRPNVAVPIYARSIDRALFALAGAAAQPSLPESSSSHP